MTVSVESGVIVGDLLGPRTRRVPTFPEGRVCLHEGCTTILSIYNSQPRCSLHAIDTDLMHLDTIRAVRRIPRNGPAHMDLRAA